MWQSITMSDRDYQTPPYMDAVYYAVKAAGAQTRKEDGSHLRLMRERLAQALRRVDVADFGKLHAEIDDLAEHRRPGSSVGLRLRAHDLITLTYLRNKSAQPPIEVG